MIVPTHHIRTTFSAGSARAWIAGIFCILLLAAACLVASSVSPAQSAWAVTSAEKQAEADNIVKQIDVLQTSLNEANAQLESATLEHDDAIAKRDQAQQRIDEQTAKLETLHERLNMYVTNMYKTGGDSSFINVILGSQTFEDFLVSWDAMTSISSQGASLVEQTKEARRIEQVARAEFEEQSKLAEDKMAEAEAAQQRIETTKVALEEELSKVTDEIAQLQYQEELAAEAARQAAAAAQAAAEENYARMQAEAQAAAQAQSAAAAVDQSADEVAVDSGADVAAPANEGIAASGTLLANPLPGYPVSSGFGYRDFNGGSHHMGIDLAAAEGTPYYAAASGVVMYATYDGGYNGGAGNWIVIAHGNGMVTKYMHSSAVYVSPGQQVSQGENIGAVGNTGQSFGAHLHFQLEFNGVAVDPYSFIF